MTNKIDILGVQFDNVTEDEAVELAIEKLNASNKMFIVTANPEIVMYANKNQAYKDKINSSDLTVADGIGVVIGSKIFDTPLKERVAGFDLMTRLLDESSKRKLRVFFLGAKKQTLKKAVANIKHAYSGIEVAGMQDGYVDINDKRMLTEVVEAKPDVIFVAMGFPKQEEWITDYLSVASHGLAMGVGGSFDVWADEVKRAPKWIQTINLEWFYRLIKDPKRIGRMMDLPRFIMAVKKEKRNRES